MDCACDLACVERGGEGEGGGGVGGGGGEWGGMEVCVCMGGGGGGGENRFLVLWGVLLVHVAWRCDQENSEFSRRDPTRELRALQARPNKRTPSSPGETQQDCRGLLYTD